MSDLLTFDPPLRGVVSAIRRGGIWVHVDNPTVKFEAAFTDKTTEGPMPKNVGESFYITKAVKVKKALRILEVEEFHRIAKGSRH